MIFPAIGEHFLYNFNVFFKSHFFRTESCQVTGKTKSRLLATNSRNYRLFPSKSCSPTVPPGQPKKSQDNQNIDAVVRQTTMNLKPKCTCFERVYIPSTTKNLDRQPEVVSCLSVGQPFIFP